jgi:chaperonin GroES
MSQSREIEKLLKLYESENIADDLDAQELEDIAQRVSRGFELDEQSRQEWLQMNEEAIKIAKQVFEEKSTPWPNAANVKYPLITSAIISFASRTYPEVVRGDKVVNAAVMGEDPKGAKEALAKNISTHMSYQLLVESPNWETDTDKLLTILPLLGMAYRKSYFDPFLKTYATDLCLPTNITVNNNVKSMETARRVTHTLEMFENDIIERMRMGIYKEYDIDELEPISNDDQDEQVYDIKEQHCYIDLDDDGYQEPYIVTLDYLSKKILRIVARFDFENIVYNKKGKIARIPAVNYFTDYHFLRNPDGSFHSLGYGSLLYPINETVNTAINQLLDAGTLANRQSGFISKGFRNIKGAVTFKPGEWKPVEVANGIDISRNIVPLPVNQPSPVLFQLVNMMINAGKELASVTEILEGQQPTQNSPATTVLAMLEQGLKDQKAILKRIYRSLTKEFEKQVRINRVYGDEMSYFNVFANDAWVKKDDYANKALMVYPVADPNLSSDAQRLARSNAIMQTAAAAPDIINKREAIIRHLENLQTPKLQQLLNPPPDPNAPPPPEVENVIAEAELTRAKARDLLVGRELEAMRIQITQDQMQAMAAEAAARVQKMGDEMIIKLTETLGKFDEAVFEKAKYIIDSQTQNELPQEQQIDFTKVDLAPLLAALQSYGNQNIPSDSPELNSSSDQTPNNVEEPPIGGNNA